MSTYTLINATHGWRWRCEVCGRVDGGHTTRQDAERSAARHLVLEAPPTSKSERAALRGIVRAIADAGLLYATKDRDREETEREALSCFPDAGYVVAWALEGQVTGHEWYSCAECDELRLQRTATSTKSKCRMSPHCEGDMVRIAPRPRAASRRRTLATATT